MLQKHYFIVCKTGDSRNTVDKELFASETFGLLLTSKWLAEACYAQDKPGQTFKTFLQIYLGPKIS
jgi:hypothetical protein